LLRLNSRLQSLIGFSSFLDRKSKVPHGISYFPHRKSQVPSAFRTSTENPQILHSFRTFHAEDPKTALPFAFSTSKITKFPQHSHFPSGKSEIPHGISNSPCENPEFRAAFRFFCVGNPRFCAAFRFSTPKSQISSGISHSRRRRSQIPCSILLFLRHIHIFQRKRRNAVWRLCQSASAAESTVSALQFPEPDLFFNRLGQLFVHLLDPNPQQAQ